jgi:hypothetical protein
MPKRGDRREQPAPNGRDLFASFAILFLQRDDADTSTMMGLPCLRREGPFFASLEPKTESLILKLPAERVSQLLESSTGDAFAPNGRPFREWIALRETDHNTRSPLIEEAWHFASNTADAEAR